jgi:tRNA (cytidine32/uridine32-2'-O)-methyltransferase
VALPEHSPREAAALLLRAAESGEVALVFGAERTGLTNDELARCQGAVRIPTDAGFSSLNLAAAVQVLCYELRVAVEAGARTEPARIKAADDAPATVAELEGLFGHLEQALATIDFFKGRSPVTIMRRLRRLYHRADLTRREVLILRGILSDAERSAVSR